MTGVLWAVVSLFLEVYQYSNTLLVPASHHVHAGFLTFPSRPHYHVPFSSFHLLTMSKIYSFLPVFCSFVYTIYRPLLSNFFGTFLNNILYMKPFSYAFLSSFRSSSVSFCFSSRVVEHDIWTVRALSLNSCIHRIGIKPSIILGTL